MSATRETPHLHLVEHPVPGRLVSYTIMQKQTSIQAGEIWLCRNSLESGDGAGTLGDGDLSDSTLPTSAELHFEMSPVLKDEGTMTEALSSIERLAFEELNLTELSICAGTIRSSISARAWQIANAADSTHSSYIQMQQQEATALLAATPRIARICSGGQTGADRAALDAARTFNVPITGWCPPGGTAEDFPEAPGLLAHYPELKETPTEGYVERTALNVRDSHATLIVAPFGIQPLSGTEMTVRFAEHFGRPHLEITSIDELGQVRAWLCGLPCALTLNVAGPRESKAPGTYALTHEVISALLKDLAV
ncbi:MAG: YpsA SLOG family protein [Atopobiaceae bacterium]|jgi:hypothetical protein